MCDNREDRPDEGGGAAAVSARFAVMPAAFAHRRPIVAAALAGYGAIFVAFLLFERPGLVIGNFYYLTIALVALATGPGVGVAAGVLADVLYAGGIVLNPKIPSADILSTATGIRFLTFTLVGFLIGWFAQNNRQLVDRLRTAADRDFLTDHWNTRAFDGLLETRLEAARPFALVLGDVDGLRAFNDAEGHAVGNELLRHAGQVIAQVVHGDDAIARVGGDEFAILTQTPGTDGVRALCGRLTAALAAHGIAMSFGWSVHPRDGRDALTLFRAANERLHAQKLIRQRLTEADVVELATDQPGRPARASA